MSGYVDLPISDKTNDLAYKDGKIVWAKGDDEILQRVKIRLRRMFGVWFLYYTAGIPYFNGQMLGSNDYEYAKLILRSEIVNTEGVTDCEEINLIIDHSTRMVSVYAKIKVNSKIYQVNEEL